MQKLDSEAPAIIEGTQPEGSWPKEGAITFSSVDMRYRDGLPLVLKSVTLNIKAQEKIGIVGRTGSGKQSFGSYSKPNKEKASESWDSVASSYKATTNL